MVNYREWIIFIAAFIWLALYFFYVPLLLINIARSKHWVLCPALIEELSISSYIGTGPALLGSSGSPKKIKVKYRYEYQGSIFYGHMVSVLDGWLFSNYNSKLYENLKKAHENKQHIQVFVNPVRPSMSLIDRYFDSLDIGMATLFTIFCCGAIYFLWS